METQLSEVPVKAPKARAPHVWTLTGPGNFATFDIAADLELQIIQRAVGVQPCEEQPAIDFEANVCAVQSGRRHRSKRVR